VEIKCPSDAGDFRYLAGRNVPKPEQIANVVAGLLYGACMRIIGTNTKKILLVALISGTSVVGSSNSASAFCTIQSSRLQQVSEREILAIIDGKCTKEIGESGYFTRIGPDVFGEVMAVYGSRRIDQFGFGWQASYGYNIVFSEIGEAYAAGVWIADADGVVHSEEMTIQNSYLTTTTTSTTTTTVAPTTTTLAPSSSKSSTKSDDQSLPKNTVTATTISDVIVDDGVEGDFAELAVRAIGNKWEITADTSYSSTPMTVRFRKSGSRLVAWNIVTTGEGSRRILTSRNLSGGTLTLLVQGQVVDRLLVP
jgi:hypothetical protein